MGERRRKVKWRNLYKGSKKKDNGVGVRLRVEGGRWIGEVRVMGDEWGQM